MNRSGVSRRILAAALVLTVAGSAAHIIGLDPDIAVTAQALAGDMSLADEFCFQENEDGSLAVSEIIVENSKDRDIIIPEMYDGRDVTVIQSAPMNRTENIPSDVYSLTIGKNIREIETGAFSGIHIGEIFVDSNNRFFTVRDGMLFTKDLRTLVYCPDTFDGTVSITAAAESIREDAFGNSAVNEIVIGASVANIPDGVFDGCRSLENFSIDNSNPNFKVVDDLLLSKDGSTVYAYPKAKGGACRLPGDVSVIKDYAFSGAALSSIDISKVSHIGNYAFSDCDNLKGVTVYLANKELGDGVFSGCDGLRSAVIEKGIKALPAALFEDCTALTSISFPTSVISMGADVFGNTMGYRKKADGFIYIAKMLYGYKGSSSEPVTLQIKDGIVAAADGALRGVNVTKISIPASMRYISADTLFPAENVRSFEVSADNKYYCAMNNFLFTKDRKKLVCAPNIAGTDSISLPQTVVEIGSHAFRYNTDIKKIYCSNNIRKFGVEPFYNGDPERAVVCMKGSAAANAAAQDDVNRIFMEAGIILSASELTLGEGETKTLMATVTPDIASKTVKWSSSAPSVVSVSSGTITAEAEGTAVITVTESTGHKAKCTVTVKKAPEKITFSRTSMTMGLSESQYLTCNTSDDAACSAYTYTSSDDSILKVSVVDGKCRIAAHKKGTASVTAVSYNGKKTQCNITVKDSPSSITMSKKEITIGVGETATISSYINDGAASMTRMFISSSTDRVEIIPTSWDCKFYGNSVGTATVTVRTYNGKYDQCKVTVKAPPRFVEMESDSIDIGLGENVTIGAVLLNSEASAGRTYTCSDPSVIKMTKTNWEAGFTGLKTGTADVTVKTYNDQEGSCKVHVKEAPDSIDLSRTSISMQVGETYTVDSIIPSGTAAYNRIWKSSNSSVAKVDNDGNITALKAGTANITVSTFNGKNAVCKITVK